MPSSVGVAVPVNHISSLCLKARGTIRPLAAMANNSSDDGGGGAGSNCSSSRSIYIAEAAAVTAAWLGRDAKRNLQGMIYAI